MKQACLLFPLLLLIFQISADIYTDYAKQWSLQHIYFRNGALRISQEELAAIRELITVSLHRSAITCRAQQEALKRVTHYWHIWQNIAQTRLNPSHDRPFKVDLAACLPEEQFLHLIDEQEQVSRDYAKIAQKVVYGNILTSQLAKNAVSDMRSQARVFMLDALANVKKHLGTLYDIAFKRTRQVVDDLHEFDDCADEDALLRSLNFADFILSYVPQLAVNTFVHADKTHNRLSQEAWQVLEKIQLIGNQVWDAIEASRSAFYQALLDELA